MSTTPADIASRIYADQAAGKHESLLAALADDVLIRLHGPSVHAGEYTGKAAFLEVMGRVAKATSDSKRTLDKLIGNEDSVVVVGQEEFTVVATGKRATGRFVHHVTFRQGKITMFEDFEPAGVDAWK